ncbi:MAG: 23S rRNA (adenine(2503)-C(2))-methyltransferase RlmN [Gammaproteobacteria bacterium]|nr:23S rRNA (adenine(2503)-C(2))-methyltransferase RlmN [Gammaproteobacteria bacterium]
MIDSVITPASASSQRSAAGTDVPVNLLDFDRSGLEQWFAERGEKPYRARQVMQWIYQRGVTDIGEMTDLSKSIRHQLQEQATVALPEVALEQLSTDGTCKWLFRLHDGNSIETVYIPESDRGTLCVSSQVGCALDCSFCATGRQGFNRNLSVGEIIAQVWLAVQLLARNPDTRQQRVTNVVMMGMGEPLSNLNNLVPALSLMMDDLAYGLSKRRVTVSTSGIVPAMDRLTAALDVSLAVSLHAPTDELRDELVPINRKYPLSELMAACRRYVDGDRKKHVLMEYVMLADVNDQPAHARELVRLLRDFPAKVNLIPFNPFPQSGYRRSGNAAIQRFWKILTEAGVLTLRRTTRGDDIAAACGQLAGAIEDKSRRELKFVEPRFGERF